ncbi:MAG: hypothetical protein EOO15_08195 [Chitinophagaceae bacterium]|nr:MAG: hypothetical protein EOO15_08195 [Chitinophagaceae bacterium]
MKRQRMLMPGAFTELNLPEVQHKTGLQSHQKSELLYRLLGLAAGLTLAALLAAALYHSYNPSPKINDACVAFQRR